jgi:hypothetical protein
MSEKRKSLRLPAVDDLKSAKKASMYGVWAAVFSAAATVLLFVFLVLASGGKAVDTSIAAVALVDALIFSAVAIGIYKESRLAAVAGLLFFVVEKIVQFSMTGETSGIIVPVILTLCYASAIRGVYALHRLRTPVTS